MTQYVISRRCLTDYCGFHIWKERPLVSFIIKKKSGLKVLRMRRVYVMTALLLLIDRGRSVDDGMHLEYKPTLVFCASW